MQPSAATAGPTAVQGKPQGPPSPGSPSYTDCAAGATGPAALKRPGPAPNPPMTSGLAQLMEEPAGGANHGRRASEHPDREGRHLPLGADEWQAAEFMKSGGWDVVDTNRGSGGATPGARDAGMHAHRGVLHSGEYVDRGAMRAAVERELGFTYEQVRSVYRQGRLSADQRELRGQIDARLLALSRAGGNMALLGRLLGFEVDEDDGCQTIKRACRRARAVEDS